jgi:hypothetical protein
VWIMAPYGAFSVVARDPKRIKPGDERTMVVRARRKEWLAELRKRAMPELGPSQHFAGADYQWHAAVTPEDLARGVARIALDAGSYRNFKSATMDPQFGLRSASGRSRLHTAYNRIWSALLDAGDGKSRCKTMGHWYATSTGKCVDCGEPDPKLADLQAPAKVPAVAS